eukprot:CAMPEP_0115186288 /NCGR_PEP_ID=MMETSP0270-20121206/9905_1 /TAXON_ID=71861 /ORGANISM="Scrippsiella trochoidea, Strain CCMP3099" /LENGTH=873 /DNA_ID=CAMNT_0002599409 /DNA_START=83 /DNA_END=2704 /DNA_ORIENTATION=+
MATHIAENDNVAESTAITAAGDVVHEAFQGFEKKLRGIYEKQLGKLTQEVAHLNGKVKVLHSENASLRAQLVRAKQLACGSSEEKPMHAPAHRGDDPVASMSSTSDREVRFGAQSSCCSMGSTLAAADKEDKQVLISMPSDSSELQGATMQALSAAAMCARRRRQPSNGPAPALGDGQRHSSQSLDPLEPKSSPSLCELLPFWKEVRGQSVPSFQQMRPGGVMQSAKHLPRRAGTQIFRDLFTTSPVSKQRIIWEMLGAIMIVTDLVTIPLQAFNHTIDHLPLSVMIAKASYWSLDIPCTFFVGYYVNGMLEVRCSKTAKRYMKTWFFVDLLIVILDWVLIIFQALIENTDNPDHLAIFRAGRVLRLLRFARLLRLLKLHSFVSKLLESIHSEYIQTLLHVGQIVTCIIVINHFIACLWYAIGTWDFDDTISRMNQNWVDENFESYHTIAYRYTTSMHWSITQFTPASMEVFPENAVERTYNIIVIILGMVTFSTFISSVTQAMTHLRKIAGGKEAQLTQLRRFLGENNVSMQLAMRVWRYYEQGQKGKPHRMMWRDVALFADIPEVLKMDLQHEVYMPALAWHPFFFHYQENNSNAMRAICYHAVNEVSFRKEQDIYREGEVADKMYFVIDGLLEHRMTLGGCSPTMDGVDDYTGIVTEEVFVGEWLAEAAVWVKWFFTGTTATKQFSVLCVLAVPGLHRVMKEYVDLLPRCCVYAESFVQHLRAQGVAMSDLATDLGTLQEMAHIAFQSDAQDESEEAEGNGMRAKFMRGLSLLSAGGGRRARRAPRASGRKRTLTNWFSRSRPNSGPSLWQPGSQASSASGIMHGSIAIDSASMSATSSGQAQHTPSSCSTHCMAVPPVATTAGPDLTAL